MKVAIIGYGKMGKEIEKMAISRKHEILLIVDNETDWKNSEKALVSCDVAIEFSNPDAVLQNIERCFKHNIPIVIGTTGWNQHKARIEDRCRSANQTMLTASNFSVGVNIFFEINRKLATLMNQFPDYDVEMEEIHHTKKLDSPSGTAISIASDIIQNLDRKKHWSEQIKNGETIHIQAKREGDVIGTHAVTYTSPIDFIEIKHHAYNRSGFALGAILAAEFICNKKGIFSFRDLMHL